MIKNQPPIIQRRQNICKEIISMFYDRDGRGIPVEWVGRVRESIKSVTPQFSTRRMVKEYIDRLYVPALKWDPLAL